MARLGDQLAEPNLISSFVDLFCIISSGHKGCGIDRTRKRHIARWDMRRLPIKCQMQLYRKTKIPMYWVNVYILQDKIVLIEGNNRVDFVGSAQKSHRQLGTGEMPNCTNHS